MTADPAFELRSAALGLGDRLTTFVVLAAALRDDSAEFGNTSEARFWSELAVFLAQIRDDYAAALRAMETNVADAYMTVVPNSEGGAE